MTSTHPTLAAEARRPNVIFIIADDLYLDMFNCTPEGKGRNVTPTFDRLAAEGVVLQGQHIVIARVHAQPLQLPHRPLREPVDVRTRDVVLAVAAELRPQMVHGDEQDIRALGRADLAASHRNRSDRSRRFIWS